MKKAKYLISALLVLMLSAVAMPVMAIGPEQAVLDTPSGVHNVWTESQFNHWINASKGGGKMNNAVIVGPPPTGDVKLVDLLNALSTDPSEYENTWIYFSSTFFKLFLINGQNMDPEQAEDAAELYPDGIYWHFVMVG